jgi:hypothetical protein
MSDRFGLDGKSNAREPDRCSAVLACFVRKGPTLIRATTITSLFALSVGFSGCALVPDAVSDSMTDPARYDLYDCKQLEAARKSLVAQAAELE